MNEWKIRKNWSDRFLPEIKQILGAHLIGEPPEIEDQQRNTDLMVLKMDAVRIACRIRKNQYLENYSHEFTVRSSLPSRSRTELTKIIGGWGDFLFYGFCDGSEQKIEFWRIIDLCEFRIWLVSYLARYGQLPGEKRDNFDGSSSFFIYDINDMPRDCVFACSESKLFAVV